MIHSNKLLSIIILTYNSEKDITDCLDSLLKNFDSEKAEIIVWDNNSKDRTREILSNYEALPFVKIIYSDENIGFARGNNEASKYAVGKYILLLNADTISDFKVYEELIEFIEKNDKVGVIGPKCVDELSVAQESFGYEFSILKEIFGKTFMSLYLEKIPLIKLIKNKLLHKAKPTEVDWIGGACALIRRNLWDKLGGLDPNYFFSYGDMIDFCYQVRKLGYKCIYYPLVQIIHKGSKSVTRDLQTRIMGLKRGYLGCLYFLHKYKKGILYIYLTKITYFLISFLKGIIALSLTPIKKEFKDIAFSHLYVSFWLLKNFLSNNYKNI
jgi:GT2 family glycosyltransferase